MKSLIFVTSLTLLLTVPVVAQNQFGVTGGLNLARLSVDPAEDISNRASLAFGVVVDHSLNDFLALNLQLMYLQKGSKAEDNTSGEKIETKLDYFEIPLMLKLFLETSTSRPYLIAGPTIGFRIGATQTVNGKKDDVNNQIKGTDLGINIGTGVRLPVGSKAIFVEGRYALGLRNINDDPQTSGTKIKSRCILFMVGITLPSGN